MLPHHKGWYTKTQEYVGKVDANCTSAPVPGVGTSTRLDPKRLGPLAAEASLSWLWDAMSEGYRSVWLVGRQVA